MESITREQSRFVITVRAGQARRCPVCGNISKSRHSEYLRTIQDLPWQGMAGSNTGSRRRFRCRNPGGSRKVFGERLPGVAEARARRTDRLGAIMRLLGYALGGLPGNRVLERLAIQVSGDIILRKSRRR